MCSTSSGYDDGLIANYVPGNVIPGSAYSSTMIAEYVPANTIPGQNLYAVNYSPSGIPGNIVPTPKNVIPVSVVSVPTNPSVNHTVSLTSQRSVDGEIRIVNPASTLTTLRFLVNNKTYTLAPGETQSISGESNVIEFDRGDSKGTSTYRLIAGTFQFRGTRQGWELNQMPEQTIELPRSVASLQFPELPVTESEILVAEVNR